MKLLPKLTLLALGVSAVPLAISGYSSLWIGQKALRQAIEDNEMTVAKQVAEYASSEIGNLLSILRVDAHIFDLTRSGNDAPSAQGLAKFLQLVYHQSDDFCAIAMFDEHGGAVGKPAYLPNPGDYDAFRNHEPMRPTDVEGVALMAPLGEALRRGQGVGPVFLGGPGAHPHVVLAVAFDPSLGGGRRILAAEVSLRRLGEHVAGLSTADTDFKLLDARARLVAAGSRKGMAKLEAQRVPRSREGELPAVESVDEYQSEGRQVIGAFAPAGTTGFGVLVDKTVQAALGPLDDIRTATRFWIVVAALIGLAVAWAFARRLSERVAGLAEGSRQIASGNLEARTEKRANDELGDLADAFNDMAQSLGSARTKILAQTDEIMAWNETLESRVEEKTRELRQAQDLLLRSRSLAALGELGAGVAHEINNPLAGVLGIAQLVLADLPPGHPARALIQDLEQQALRIRKIVQNLLRFAQRQGGEDFTPVDLPRVLDDAVELCGPSDLQGAGIEVVRRYASPTPAVRGSATQLQQAFIHLIQNARGAMPGGGKLTLETSVPDEKLVRVRITDTGTGISPEHVPRVFDPFFTTKTQTPSSPARERGEDEEGGGESGNGKRNGNGVGLGLAVVHKTIEDHGGRVQVQSEVGQGTVFEMTFPIDAGKALRA